MKTFVKNWWITFLCVGGAGGLGYSSQVYGNYEAFWVGFGWGVGTMIFAKMVETKKS